MQDQLDLFSAVPNRPLARDTDPITSHEAAEAVIESGAVDGQKRVVLALVRRWPGRTTNELAQLSGEDRHMIAKRTSLVEADDLIYRGEPKTCSVSGRRALTWWPL